MADLTDREKTMRGFLSREGTVGATIEQIEAEMARLLESGGDREEIPRKRRGISVVLNGLVKKGKAESFQDYDGVTRYRAVEDNDEEAADADDDPPLPESHVLTITHIGDRSGKVKISFPDGTKLRLPMDVYDGFTVIWRD